MDQKTLDIEIRSSVGKGAARRLRAKGIIPGVVYGKGMEPVAVSVSPKALAAAIAGEGGQNNLITLQGGGDLDGKVVIVCDLLKDALRRDLLHVDFHKINMADKVRVHVPVVTVGTSVGVKEGGLLDLVMHSLDIECLPNSIPEHIEVDITNLTIGGSVHVGELKLPAALKCLDDSKAAVVSIHGRAAEVQETPEAGE